ASDTATRTVATAQRTGDTTGSQRRDSPTDVVQRRSTVRRGFRSLTHGAAGHGIRWRLYRSGGHAATEERLRPVGRGFSKRCSARPTRHGFPRHTTAGVWCRTDRSRRSTAHTGRGLRHSVRTSGTHVLTTWEGRITDALLARGNTLRTGGVLGTTHTTRISDRGATGRSSR